MLRYLALHLYDKLNIALLHARNTMPKQLSTMSFCGRQLLIVSIFFNTLYILLKYFLFSPKLPIYWRCQGKETAKASSKSIAVLFIFSKALARELNSCDTRRAHLAHAQQISTCSFLHEIFRIKSRFLGNFKMQFHSKHRVLMYCRLIVSLAT